jgi:hypothetical protein
MGQLESKHHPKPRHHPSPNPSPPSPTPPPPSPGGISVGPRPSGNFHPVTIADINAGTVKHTYVQITGTISTAHNETDGDVHLHVNDSSAPALAADGKTVMCRGATVPAPINGLVCEIVPETPLPVPAVGQRVTITGTLRYDETHLWWEIHPIAQIQ